MRDEKAISLHFPSSPLDSQNSSQQSTTIDLENNHVPRKKPKLHLATEPENVLREIPGSNNMSPQLSSKSKNSMKGRKTQVLKLSRIHNLLRVDFEKNVETCREVKTLKLKELSDSVCQVRSNGKPEGSGFLLFGNFVLTNAHVIKNIYNDVSEQFNGRVTVNFSFYDLEQPVGGSVEVEEVVGYEYNPDVSPCDWALLKLSANENLPRPLAAHFGFLPKSGEIYIIGHPDGGVKKIDSCLIVPTENRIQIVERHVQQQNITYDSCFHDGSSGSPVFNQGHENQELFQLITHKFFQNMAISVQQHQGLTYESCFYQGSSGSPVFDKYYNVVAVHTGGYTYKSTSGQQNVIEYGHALSDITERVIIQMVERGRFDVLKDFLTCGSTQRYNILINVKKLVDSRNLTTFKNVVNNSVNITDTTLKELFEFFSHVEAPVPMDIN